MAVTYRFPILLWRDHENWWTASLLEWEEPAGTGRTAALAAKQLQEYIHWRYENDRWLDEPDFQEPRLFQQTVTVRPEYSIAGRRYPCDETVSLRVHGVQGKQQHGLLICTIPFVDVQFYYYEEKALKKLVPHYVRQRLEGVTPQSLSRFLPPPHVELDQITVTLKNRRPRYQSWTPELETLPTIAESIADPRSRRKTTRPWERDREVSDLVHRVKSEKANVLVVGETGSGKTTVIFEAAKQLERQADSDEQESKSHRSWLTSGGRLIAGMKYL